jgi:hypothetical protein
VTRSSAGVLYGRTPRDLIQAEGNIRPEGCVNCVWSMLRGSLTLKLVHHGCHAVTPGGTQHRDLPCLKAGEAHEAWAVGRGQRGRS